MSCQYQSEDRIDVLLDYTAGRLDDARRARLEAHMAECEECAEFRAEQGELWRALDRYETPEISAGFNRGVWQKIDAAAAEPWYACFGRGLREGAWKPVFPLAAAAALVAAGFLFDHHEGKASSQIALVSAAEAEQVQITLEDLQLLQNLNTTAAEAVEPIL
jgi:anti-sigma factor RsiW